MFRWSIFLRSLERLHALPVGEATIAAYGQLMLEFVYYFATDKTLQSLVWRGG